MLAIDSINQVAKNLDIDENIVQTKIKNDVSLSIIHSKEENEMSKLFHIKIWVKKTKVDALFDSIS
jgi:hypothetical protein